MFISTHMFHISFKVIKNSRYNLASCRQRLSGAVIGAKKILLRVEPYPF